MTVEAATAAFRPTTGEGAIRPLVFTKRTKRGDRDYAAPPAPVPLVDTHAHLTCFWTKDPAEVLVRAAQAGVRGLVTLYDPLGDEMDLATYRSALDAWLDGARALAARRIPSDGEPVPASSGRQELVSGSMPTGAQGASPTPMSSASPAAESDSAPSMFSVSFATESDSASPGAPVLAKALDELIANLRFLVGAHPYGTPDYTDATHAVLKEALADPRCVGVGEIGLDYHFDADDDIEAAPHDMQMAVMARQLALACARELPVELHVRNDAGDEGRQAHADALRVLTEVGVPPAGCVLHCFGEDRACMERFLEAGCFVAFGGAATFKRNDAVREAFAACPLDRLVFETDCPYMAPEPVRGIECEPALIAFTAERLVAERVRLTGEDPAAVARAAWENARRLFF